MANENEKMQGINPEGQGTDPTDFDLLNEFKEYKKNSVPKEDYEKLKAENKKLIKDFLYGSGDSAEVKETPVDINALRKELFGDDVENLTNRDFWKKTSELYHARLEEGVNIFLPKGQKTRYDRKDYEVVSDMMETIDSMLSETEDNPTLFTTLFNSAIS